MTRLDDPPRRATAACPRRPVSRSFVALVDPGLRAVHCTQATPAVGLALALNIGLWRVYAALGRFPPGTSSVRALAAVPRAIFARHVDR